MAQMPEVIKNLEIPGNRRMKYGPEQAGGLLCLCQTLGFSLFCA